MLSIDSPIDKPFDMPKSQKFNSLNLKNLKKAKTSITKH